jgi:alpha-tubulin suppressor-like RCC1 family protein
MTCILCLPSQYAKLVCQCCCCCRRCCCSCCCHRCCWCFHNMARSWLPLNSAGPQNCTVELAANPTCKRCVRSMLVGVAHICVLLYDGSVECVGFGSSGELGTGTSTGATMLVKSSALPHVPVSLGGAASFSTCVLLAAPEANTVYCFGENSNGALGSQGYIQGLRSTPRITELVGNGNQGFYCAAYAASGNLPLQCWGSALGSSSINISGTNGATSLTIGGQACAVLSDSGVGCWSVYQPVATRKEGINNAVRVATGGDTFTCAIVRPSGQVGSLWCWGFDQPYRVVVSRSYTPWQVGGLSGNILDVAAASEHVCVLVEVDVGSGDVYCWGRNTMGQLGQNHTITAPFEDVQPLVRVAALSQVTSLFAARTTTCALTVSKRVMCWSDNGLGQLGIGTTASPITWPVAMKKLCA